MHSTVKIDFSSPAIFSFVQLCAGKKAVTQLCATNTTASPLFGLSLTVSSEPAFFAPYTVELSSIAPKTKRLIDCPLDYDKTYLAYLSENCATKITARLFSEEEEVALAAHTCDVLTHDAWGGVHFSPEFLSCLVTPQQPQVQDLARAARAILKRKHITLPFDGYHKTTELSLIRKTAEATLAAVFEAVRGSRIIYSIQPPELSRRGAKVQLSEDTLAKKAGNALDAAILFASCAECLGLNTVLVLSGGAVLCGAFVEDKRFAAPVVDSKTQFTAARTQDDSLYLIDATAMANGTSFGFSAARIMAEKALENEGDYFLAVDIAACRRNGIAPLDDRIVYEDGMHFEKPGMAEDDEDIFRNDTAIEEASPVPFVGNLRAIREQISDFSPYNALIRLPQKQRVGITVKSIPALSERLSEEIPIPLLEERPVFAFSGDVQDAVIRLNDLDRQSGEAPAEGTLFLAFGELYYPCDGESVSAPLFLLPIEMVHERGRMTGFRSDGVCPKPNYVLLYYLAERFSIDLHALKEIHAATLSEYLSAAFAKVKLSIPKASSVSFKEKSAAFVRLDTQPGALLAALAPTRLEAQPFAKALCAGEWENETNDAEPSFPAPNQIDPLSLPMPFAMSTASIRALQTAMAQDTTLVTAPPCGGKTRLATALCFANLNFSRTVLFVTGEQSSPAETLRDLDEAGIADLALPLSKRAPAEANFEMNHTEMFPPEEYFGVCTDYTKAREQLSVYEETLKKPLNCGCNLEEAIFSFDQVRGAPDCIHFSPEQTGHISVQEAQKRFAVIRALADTLTAIQTPVGHPLHYVKAKEFSYEIKTEAVRLLEECAQKTKQYITFLRGSCAGMFLKTKIVNTVQEQAFLDILKMLGEQSCLCPCYFESETSASALAMVETILTYGKELSQMRDTVLSQFSKEAFDLPIKDMIVAWRDTELKKGTVRKKEQKAIQKRLAACCTAPARADFAVLDKLYQLEKYMNYKAYLHENAPLIQKLFGVDIVAPENDTNELWDRLSALYAACVDFDRHLHLLSENTQAVRADSVRYMKGATEEDAARCESLHAAIVEMKSELSRVEARLATYLAIDLEDLKLQHADNLYDALPKIQQEILRGMDSYQEWTAFLNACDAARACGFDKILELIFAEKLRGENLEDAYARAFFASLCESVFLSTPQLAALRGGAFEETLAALHAQREEIFAFARRDLLSKHLRRYTAYLEESGWNKEQTLAVTPAVFARNTYAIMQRYPVLVASATDAAAFLDATPARFDLLIFDNAQTLSMPTALALAPRAAKICILGTEPLSLYRNNACSDAPILRDREDLPTFWGHAKKLLTPITLPLSYPKSAALSAIICAAYNTAFSALLFADSSEGIATVKTPGKYDPVGCTNVQEAMQTVEEAVRLLNNADHAPVSLGICASTRAQKLLILRILAKRLRAQPELLDALQKVAEPFYVFSPEDGEPGRRDTILWSLVVAPEENGRLTRAFPLFVRENGAAQILSVLCAARQKLCVLHSIHLESLDFLRVETEALTVFGRIGRILFAPPEDIRATTAHAKVSEHPIAQKLAASLQKKGYACLFDVSAGDFLLDMVIQKPGNPDHFQAAVLFDSTVFSVCAGHPISEAELSAALKVRGFDVLRVRDTDWFENDAAETERLLKKLPSKPRKK